MDFICHQYLNVRGQIFILGKNLSDTRHAEAQALTMLDRLLGSEKRTNYIRNTDELHPLVV